MREKKILIFFAFVLLVCGSIFSAPYNGDEFELLQPDGSYVLVKVYGDEYYTRVESLDGYTLIRDPKTNWICYADLKNGELVSTEIPYRMTVKTTSGTGVQGQANLIKPAVQQGLLESKEIVNSKVQKAKSLIGEPPTLPLITSNSSGNLSAQAAPASVQRVGTYIGLTLLIDFPDVRATIPQSEINNFCNQIGYTGYSNYGSVRDYYKAASNNKLDYQNYVADYYTAKYNKSYYTDPSVPYGQRARELIKEALQALDAKGFNFSTLSTSGGYIIAINAFYAGNADNAWSQGLWPHASSMYGQFCADGVCSGRYQITNIGSSLSIRTFCHENGHMLLQYPDLYDYGYESSGVGNFCLMAAGGNSKRPVILNPYFRQLSGWEEVTAINSSTNATFTIEANKIASLKYTNPSNSQEAFYIEPRYKSGWNYYYPDSGLVIWHVDGNGSNNNEQMTCSQHYLVSVEQADGKYDLEYGRNSGDSNDLFDNTTAGFGPNTNPNSNWWCSGASGLRVSNISPAGTTMTFNIGSGGTVVPTNTATKTNTPTPIPPTKTNTPVPPTNTVTRTNTPIPPTNTATRTNTPVPLTNTPVVTQTGTEIITLTLTPTEISTNTATMTNTLTSTATRTNTPVLPTNTATRTNTLVPPTNTATRTPTPGITPQTSKLNLQVRNLDTDPCSGSNFRAEFKIINNSSVNINLSTLKVRMWFNNAEPIAFVNNDWVKIYNSAGTYLGYATATKDADASIPLCTYAANRKANQYRTFSFSSYNIPAGGYAVFPVWFWRNGYAPFDVNCDDFSKLGSTTTFSENKYLVLYENGKVVLEYVNSTQVDANTGIEPCIASDIQADVDASCWKTPMPTTTQTPVPTQVSESENQSITKVISYPNPVNPDKVDALRVKFNLGKSVHKIIFKIYTVSGKLIMQHIINENFAAGENEIAIKTESIRNMASGLYLFLIAVEDENNKIIKSETGKILIMR